MLEQKTVRMIAGFELLEKIGQGGMGAVFKARQVSLDRMVAIKLLPPKLAKKDPVFVDRFIREARVSAKLNHPNIVQGIEVGCDEKSGLYYFAMEFIDGPTVRTLLKEEGTLPERKAIKIAHGVAEALACAHRAGIVHRDIKPDNILLTARGEPKLADLGLARRVADDEGDSDAEIDLGDANSADAGLTQAGKAVGTPHYMAPEQAKGQLDNIDTRSDLYALGATMFHMVTGTPPFRGKNATAIMRARLTHQAPAARMLNPKISEGTSDLIERLMQKDREKRFQNPEELIARLKQLGEEKDQERPAVAGRPSATKITNVRRERPVERRATNSGSGGVTPGSLIAGTVVLLASLFAISFLQKTRNPKDTEPTAIADKAPSSALAKNSQDALSTHEKPPRPQPAENAEPAKAPAPAKTQEPAQETAQPAESATPGTPNPEPVQKQEKADKPAPELPERPASSPADPSKLPSPTEEQRRTAKAVAQQSTIRRDDDSRNKVALGLRILDTDTANNQKFTCNALPILGQFSDGLRACDKVLKKIPNDPRILEDRGVCNLALGKYAAAVEDFRAARLQMSKGFEYILLWEAGSAAMVSDQMGELALAELKAISSQFDPAKRVTPVLNFYAGKVTEEQCLAASESGEQSDVCAKKCEFYYYLGVWHRMKKDPTKARAYFEKCIEWDVTSFLEPLLAKEELTRMGHAPLSSEKSKSEVGAAPPSEKSAEEAFYPGIPRRAAYRSKELEALQDNKMSRLREGDWVQFQVEAETNTFWVSVLKGKVGNEVTVEEITVKGDKRYPNEHTHTLFGQRGAQIVREGRESIKIGDKTYDCTWYEMQIGDPAQNNFSIQWVAHDGPWDGVVKRVLSTPIHRTVQILKAFGGKDSMP